jgi:hypothetical protein
MPLQTHQRERPGARADTGSRRVGADDPVTSPDSVSPGQLQVALDQRLPVHDVPVQRLPAQPVPLQRLPSQVIPVQRLPVHPSPVQLLPFHTPPVQVVADAWAAAIVVLVNACPKMSF